MVSLSPSLQARLSTPLKIGSFEVKSRVLQSPLSGVTDLVFRRLVRRYAPESMMYTEMVNATGLHYVKELPKIMEVDPNERPISIQLFDCRPDFWQKRRRWRWRKGQIRLISIWVAPSTKLRKMAAVLPYCGNQKRLKQLCGQLLRR
jgi:hypothetical protein